MPSSSPAKYDKVAIAIHWLAAILMIIMVFFGEDLMEGEKVAAAAAAGSFLPSLHVSLGSAILILTLVRIGWRLTNPPPELPATMAPWEVTVTKVVHGLFYLLMIVLPLTGWLATPDFLRENGGVALSVFGLFPLPGAPDIGEFVGGIHNLGSKAAMALIILHVLAALKHQFVNRDGLLARMSPH